jgi:hypothetical protein
MCGQQNKVPNCSGVVQAVVAHPAWLWGNKLPELTGEVELCAGAAVPNTQAVIA